MIKVTTGERSHPVVLSRQFADAYQKLQGLKSKLKGNHDFSLGITNSASPTAILLAGITEVMLWDTCLWWSVKRSGYYILLPAELMHVSCMRDQLLRFLLKPERGCMLYGTSIVHCPKDAR